MNKHKLPTPKIVLPKEFSNFERYIFFDLAVQSNWFLKILFKINPTTRSYSYLFKNHNKF
jgi:hypothetical protein